MSVSREPRASWKTSYWYDLDHILPKQLQYLGSAYACLAIGMPKATWTSLVSFPVDRGLPDHWFPGKVEKCFPFWVKQMS